MTNTTQGFTLIELLIVIAIIGILAAVLIPNLLAARGKANDTAAQAYARNCYTAMETMRDSTTQKLQPAQSCTDSALGSSALASTVAVTANHVTEDTALSKDAVDVTSSTGKTFCFDGAAMKQGSTSAGGACS